MMTNKAKKKQEKKENRFIPFFFAVAMLIVKVDMLLS